MFLMFWGYFGDTQLVLRDKKSERSTLLIIQNIQERFYVRRNFIWRWGIFDIQRIITSIQ